jgi:hypothetical protein
VKGGTGCRARAARPTRQLCCNRRSPRVVCPSRFGAQVTKAQGSKVITIPWADGSTQYLWLGNQWVTSQLPGNPRNSDLLYWTVLQFNATGGLQQIAYEDTTTLQLAD